MSGVTSNPPVPGRRRAASPRYRVRAVAEAHLDRHDRRRLGDLLADAFDEEEVRRHAHFGVPPLVRAIARRRGTPVAHAGLWRLHATPARYRVLGVGCAAVHPDHRGQGLARATVELVLDLAGALAPDLIVTRTDLLVSVFARRGFAAVEDRELPALDPYGNWLAWTETGAIPRIEALDPSDV